MAAGADYDAPRPGALILRARPDARLRVTRDGTVVGGGPEAQELARRIAKAGLRLKPVAPASTVRGRDVAGTPAGAALADLASYFWVVAADERKPAEDVAERVRELADEAVDGVYVKPPTALPVLPPDRVRPAPPAGYEPPQKRSFRRRQGYLRAAPDGIGVEEWWDRPGGLGQGVGIVDVEMEWRWSHVDLRENPVLHAAGDVPDDLEARNHGTNVLGILAADHNGRGVHGICPAADVRTISIGRDEWASSAAVREAADRLRPGDVILVELMRRPGPRSPDLKGFLAIEWWPDDFDAIQYATRKGIIVVEAAGNGFEHLDAPEVADTRGFPDEWRNPFLRDPFDSGAIVVGAGAPPARPHDDRAGADGQPDRSRLDFSNWGTCLDAQGWGLEVTTTGGFGTGGGDLPGGDDEDSWYTDRFNGTSSAAPIVVGALACVQGILRAEGRRPLTPAEARQALRETGAPQQPVKPGALLERIGNRPNVTELIEWARGERPVQPEPEARRPSRTRRRGMKVTITIEDEGGGEVSLPGKDGGGAEVRTPSVTGLPHVRGPGVLVVPTDRGDVEVQVPPEVARELVEYRAEQSAEAV